MFGQKNYPDPHQEIIDKFLEDNNPYVPSQPMRIDLRKYIQYARERGITDPSSIPDEILDQFMLAEGTREAAQ